VCSGILQAEDEDSGSHDTESQLNVRIHRLFPPNKKRAARQREPAAGGPGEQGRFAPGRSPVGSASPPFDGFALSSQRRTWENRWVAVVTGVTSVRRRAVILRLPHDRPTHVQLAPASDRKSLLFSLYLLPPFLLNLPNRFLLILSLTTFPYHSPPYIINLTSHLPTFPTTLTHPLYSP